MNTNLFFFWCMCSYLMMVAKLQENWQLHISLTIQLNNMKVFFTHDRNFTEKWLSATRRRCCHMVTHLDKNNVLKTIGTIWFIWLHPWTIVYYIVSTINIIWYLKYARFGNRQLLMKFWHISHVFSCITLYLNVWSMFLFWVLFLRVCLSDFHHLLMDFKEKC